MGDFNLKASNGVTLVEGVDYIYTYNSKITVTITASGINKLKSGATLLFSYGMSFREGYTPGEEPVGNHATIYLVSKDAYRAVKSEDDYFSFLFKSLRVEKVEKGTEKPLAGALFSLFKGE